MMRARRRLARRSFLAAVAGAGAAAAWSGGARAHPITGYHTIGASDFIL
jgi:hypothetical protein